VILSAVPVFYDQLLLLAQNGMFFPSSFFFAVDCLSAQKQAHIRDIYSK